MSYRNAIKDIPAGSLWECTPKNWTVRIAAAAAGYVVFRVPDGRYITSPERGFRADFAPLYDREAIRSQFSMSLSNLGEFRVYWLPEKRRILCRSKFCSRRFRVPEGAILVGAYSSPCSIAAFFADLDGMLAPHAPERQEARA